MIAKNSSLNSIVRSVLTTRVEDDHVDGVYGMCVGCSIVVLVVVPNGTDAAAALVVLRY